jgi:hypothetical protein
MNGVDTEGGGGPCSEDEEDEARSHSASHSSAPPDHHDQDSLDSERGGALNLVSIIYISSLLFSFFIYFF